MASNRGSQAALALNSDKQFEDEMLARQKYADQAQHGAMLQGMFGNMLAAETPSNRPAGVAQSPFAALMLGGSGHDALMNNVRAATDSQAQGGPTLPTFSDPRLVQSQFGEPSAWEKLLGILGAGASAYGAAAGKLGGSGSSGGPGSYYDGGGS
jgi:hypothetical protein